MEFLIKFNKSDGIVVICYMLFYPKLFSNLLEFAENISNRICVGATSVVPHCTKTVHLQFPGDLLTFTEEILNGKLNFFAECLKNQPLAV